MLTVWCNPSIFKPYDLSFFFFDSFKKNHWINRFSLLRGKRYFIFLRLRYIVLISYAYKQRLRSIYNSKIRFIKLSKRNIRSPVHFDFISRYKKFHFPTFYHVPLLFNSIFATLLFSNFFYHLYFLRHVFHKGSILYQGSSVTSLYHICQFPVTISNDIRYFCYHQLHFRIKKYNRLIKYRLFKEGIVHKNKRGRLRRYFLTRPLSRIFIWKRQWIVKPVFKKTGTKLRKKKNKAWGWSWWYFRRRKLIWREKKTYRYYYWNIRTNIIPVILNYPRWLEVDYRLFLIIPLYISCLTPISFSFHRHKANVQLASRWHDMKRLWKT